MYNCAWRFLGEQRPHAVPVPIGSAAGTYFHHVPGKPMEGGWYAFDHVLVTGGLLTEQFPYLDESRLCVRADTGSLVDGRPSKFEYAAGAAGGLSDHLPIAGVVAHE